MARQSDRRLDLDRGFYDSQLIHRLEAEVIETTSSTSGALLDTNNLSDVSDAATARSNLGAAASAKTVTTQTGNYTVLTTDDIVLVNGTYTMTLPTAVGATGKEYIVKNIGTGTVTVDGDGVETIDANATVALSPYEALKIVSDGTEWWIV